VRTVTRAKWSEVIERWRASGQGAAAFARANGLNAGTLTYWKSRLRREALAAGAARDRQVAKVQDLESLRAVAALVATELDRRVASAVPAMRVQGGFDDPTLRALLGVGRNQSDPK
jgi:transposase-like protein